MTQDQIKARLLLDRAQELRLERLSPAQREAKRLVDARAELLQSGPIRRGPNAPADGSFGGVRKGV